MRKVTRIGPKPWDEMTEIERDQFDARLAKMSREQRDAAINARPRLDTKQKAAVLAEHKRQVSARIARGR